MLKRYAIRACAAAALLAGAGCDDDAYLSEVPYDFVGPENFYRTTGDALAAVSGVYASAVHSSGNSYYGQNFVMLVEFLTEMQTPYLSATNERSLVDNYTFTPAHSYIYSSWQSAYQAINRANSVVERVPNIAAADPAIRDRVVAEAKFLRALHYFNLVRMFGGVPLRTTETTSLEELQQSRAAASDVYAQIVTDLQDAIRVLPAARTYSGADVGRASRGAAKTLLAKVHLQRAVTLAGANAQQDYQAALTLLRDVKANEGYRLVAEYGTLFDMVNEANSEVIFDVQCSRANGIGCRLSNQVAPRNSNYGSSQNGSFTAEEPFFLEFAANDRRRAATWQLTFTNKQGAAVTYGPTTFTASGLYGADTPYMAKFLDRQSTTAGNDEPNYIILRYADNLLMEAEAINEISGPTAEAYAAVNEVRQRAGIGNLVAGLSKAAFKDSLFHERRLELAMEGPNGYFDSQRNWAWAKARVEANMALGLGGALGQLPSAQRVRPSRYPKARVALDDKFKLLPIPQRARDLNPLLTQNPGY